MVASTQASAPAPPFIISKPKREARYIKILVYGPTGAGKMLPLSTPIPTPDGWSTIGTLKLGDLLFDAQGNVCEVTYLSPIDLHPEAYNITFSDKTQQVACVDHLWQTERHADRIGHTERVSVVTTREIKDSVRTKPESGAPNGYSGHAVRLAAPLNLPPKEFIVDPYVLGAWLGDGTTNIPEITTMDAEVLGNILEAGYRLGPAREGCFSGKANTYRVFGLLDGLRELGVLNNKHIPQAYLRGSYDQRLNLLQGLMDTDGTTDYVRNSSRGWSGGATYFCSSRKELADQVYELICSLGMQGWVTGPIAAGYRPAGRGTELKLTKPAYRVIFRPHIPCYRINRKLERQHKVRKTSVYRYVRSVEPSASTPMRCIQVNSPDHLFLVGRSMLPTHNTHFAASADQVPGMQDVLYIDAEAGDLTLLDTSPNINRIQIGNFSQIARVFEFLKAHLRYHAEGNLAKVLEIENRFREEPISEPPRYRTVVVDSLSEIQAYHMYQILGIKIGDKRLDEEFTKASWDEYDQSINAMRHLVRSFRDLPMHVVFVAGEVEKETENKRHVRQPNFTGKLVVELPGFMDLVGYLRAEAPDEKGIIHRRLSLQSERDFKAKSRFSAIKVPYLNDPTMRMLAEAAGIA